MEPEISLSEYVRQKIDEKSLTHRQIAANSQGGISPTYVNDILQNKIGSPTVERLQSLAKGLRVPEEEIFRVARGLPREPHADYNTPKAQLLRDYDECSPEYQRDLEIYASFLRHRSITNDPPIPPELRKEFEPVTPVE